MENVSGVCAGKHDGVTANKIGGGGMVHLPDSNGLRWFQFFPVFFIGPPLLSGLPITIDAAV